MGSKSPALCTSGGPPEYMRSGPPQARELRCASLAYALTTVDLRNDVPVGMDPRREWIRSEREVGGRTQGAIGARRGVIIGWAEAGLALELEIGRWRRAACRQSGAAERNDEFLQEQRKEHLPLQLLKQSRQRTNTTLKSALKPYDNCSERPSAAWNPYSVRPLSGKVRRLRSDDRTLPIAALGRKPTGRLVSDSSGTVAVHLLPRPSRHMGCFWTSILQPDVLEVCQRHIIPVTQKPVLLRTNASYSTRTDSSSFPDSVLVHEVKPKARSQDDPV